ncbi:PepSY domain-containing protein [Stutzerimonas urumqiensis]|uniref:PepSY domain-containing protein n=1 Tax=Stutzerimonas urumqiensis TaxID=638269 RepID=UPI003BA94FA3
MKRQLYLWHRWLGIGLCLFLALWCLSGMVMLYVGYPKLVPSEHLERLPPLAADCCVPLDTALAAVDGADPVGVRLTSVAGAPRYLIDRGEGPLLAVDAQSGRRIAGISAFEALASARAFAGNTAVGYRGLVQEDAWTFNHALDRDRPLHRVQTEDDQRRLLYVSSHTGAVVRDATAHERTWNWLGAWLHWLYPLRGGPLDGIWGTLLIYSGLLGAVMAALGMAVGLLRWRFRRPYRSGSRSPYAAGYQRWHHLTGLLFGVPLVIWAFSGAMSMEPWDLFKSRSALSPAALRGGELTAEAFPVETTALLRRFRQGGLEPRELEWRLLGGAGYVVATDATGASLILPMGREAQPLERLPAALLERAARAMNPTGEAHIEWLDHYDVYYYARAEPSLYSHLPRRLPVMRVRFDDPAATWVHLDPHTGALIEQSDSRRRAVRWVFKLLHSWDWPPLLDKPLLRDALLMLFSLGALAVSLTGVVIGWRRLVRGRRRPRRAPLPAAAEAEMR